VISAAELVAALVVRRDFWSIRSAFITRIEIYMTKEPKFYGWTVLGVNAFALFFEAGSALYAFGVFLPILCKAFGWSRGAASIGTACLMGCMLLCSPWAGLFISKFGPRVSMVLGDFLIAAALFSLSALSTLWHLYIAYSIMGIGLSLASNITGSTLASHWFYKRLPTANSIIISAQSFGGVVMVSVTVAIIAKVGWRSTYLVLGSMVFLFSCILSALFVRNSPEELGQFPDGIAASAELVRTSRASSSGPSPDFTVKQALKTPGFSLDFTVKQALRTPAFWYLAICNDIPLFIYVFLTTHQIAFALSLGASNQTAGFCMSIIPLVSLVGTLGTGALALKFDMRKLGILASAFMTIGMALAVVTKSVLMVYIYSVVFGLGFGAIWVSVMTLISRYFGKSNYSKIFGLVVFFQFTSTLSAPLAGFIYDTYHSYARAFTVAAGMGVISLICMILLRAPSVPATAPGVRDTHRPEVLTV
jgi:MFS family permease